MTPAAEVGLISDTHGLLRPEAVRALAGVTQIIHAGDVGSQNIVDELAAVAPVMVVRGNTDHGAAAEAWPPTDAVDVAGRVLLAVHDIDDLDIDPVAAGVAVVIYGHSHRPAAELRAGVLFVNPGAAGHRRFSLPITVARLRLRDGGFDLRYVDLDAGVAEDWQAFPG
jgi:hypothetical protein